MEQRQGRGRGRGRATYRVLEEGNMHASQEQEDGVDMVSELLTVMRALTEAVRGGVRDSEPQSIVAMREFQRLDPPTFTGEPDPRKATKWLEMITTILDALELEEDEIRVRLATFQLREDAREWWEFTQTTVDGTWISFTRVFLEKYFPRSSRDAYREEFLNLIQGNMSVIQYEARFVSLSRYAPEMVATEELRTKRFERGLRPAIKDRLAATFFEVYTDIVEAATRVEAALAEGRKIREGRFRQGGASTSYEGRQSKKQRSCESSSSSEASRSQSYVAPAPSVFSFGRSGPRRMVCYRCHQAGHRASECPQRLRRPPSQQQQQQQQQSQMLGRVPSICYQCGQVGHFRRECPQGVQPAQATPGRQSQQTGTQLIRTSGRSSSSQLARQSGVRGGGNQTQRRAYALAEPDVPMPSMAHESTAGPLGISGTILVYRSRASALIDTGASHSFISSAFAHALGLDIDVLEKPLLIDTPLSGTTALCRVCRACEIEIADHILVFDFIVLDMSSFDIILGMDWLIAFRASIDCDRQRVFICTPDGDSFYFVGDRDDGRIP